MATPSSKGGDKAPRRSKAAAPAAAAATAAAAPAPTTAPAPTPTTAAAAPSTAASASRQYWLLKSEPDPHVVGGVDLSYGWERFASEVGGVGRYTGVRNGQAKNTLRDRMRAGDLAFFYHSSTKVPGIAGIVEVVRPAIPDADALNPRHPLYDARATPAEPRWYAADVRAVRPMTPYVSLPMLRAHAAELGDMTLLRQPRLSVQPVKPHEWAAVLRIEAAAAAAGAGGGADEGATHAPPPAVRRRGSSSTGASAPAPASTPAPATVAPAPAGGAGNKRRRGA